MDKGSFLIPREVYFLLLVVLDAVRILRSRGALPSSGISEDVPQYFVKNTEGVAKYKVGFKRSPSFSQKMGSLCANKSTSLREHKHS